MILWWDLILFGDKDDNDESSGLTVKEIDERDTEGRVEYYVFTLDISIKGGDDITIDCSGIDVHDDGMLEFYSYDIIGVDESRRRIKPDAVRYIVDRVHISRLVSSFMESIEVTKLVRKEFWIEYTLKTTKYEDTRNSMHIKNIGDIQSDEKEIREEQWEHIKKRNEMRGGPELDQEVLSLI